MLITEFEQGTDEWLSVRLGRISASRLNKLITTTGKASASGDKYLASLIAERLTGRREEVFVNSHMERGTRLESSARCCYEWETGNLVTECGFILDDLGEFGCSPDGLIGDDGGIEIKVPADSTMMGYHLDNEKFYTAYKQQVQCCMLVTGRAWWDLYAYSDSIEAICIRIERDDEYIEKMLAVIMNAIIIINDTTEKMI